MKKLFLICLATMALAISTAAQGGFTTVSGAIVDPAGIAWTGGSISAQLVTPGGASPTLNGIGFSATTVSGLLGPGGTFTIRLGDNGVILPSGTQWAFTVNIAPGVPPPFGTGSQSFSRTVTINCSTNTPATCTSNAMVITASLAPVPALTNSLTTQIAGIFTVATLPAAPAVNTLAIVTNGFGGITSAGTGNNCISGGGTTTALCRWNGATWLPVGGVIPSFGSSSCIAALLFLDNSGIIECSGVGSPDGLYYSIGNRELFSGAHASTAGFPFAASCTDCGTGSLTGVLVSIGKDNSANPTAYTDIHTKVTNNTAGAIAAEMQIDIANGGTFTPPPGITLPLSIRILPNGQIVFVGQTSGGAQIGSAAVGGTPNPINLPTTTGAPGAALVTDGNNPQQLSWNPALTHNVQAYTVTFESVDTALTGSVLATVITQAVTMPSTGCPCRVQANWAQYMTTTGSAVVSEAFVSDATNNFAEAEWPIPVNNGPSGTGAGLSPVTYTNSAVVTFTLNVEVDGAGVTARAAPFHAFGLRHSRLELTIFTSN